MKIIFYFFLCSICCFGRQSATAGNVAVRSSSGTLFCSANSMDVGFDRLEEFYSLPQVENEFYAGNNNVFPSLVHHYVSAYFDCYALIAPILNYGQYKLTGRLSKSDVGSKNVATILSEDLYNGTYTLKITSRNRVIKTFKLSKV